MPRLGELPPERWTEELERTGRAVFPARRGQYLVIALVLLALLARAISNVVTADGQGWTWVGVALSSAGLVICLGGILTGWPALTVDQTGIRLGRRQLRWNEIAAVGPVFGPRLGRTLPITAVHPGTAQLAIRQTTAKDLDELARWLSDQLHAHR